MPDVQQVLAWRGNDVVDRDGDKIGKIEEIYLDEQTDQPEWLAVKTGLFGGKLTFIPLREATAEGDGVRVPYENSLVKDAPNAEADGALSQDEEQALYRHYGLEYGESRSDSGLAEGTTDRDGDGDRDVDVDRDRDRGTVGRDTSGPETDGAMTRSEEELRVGKTERETGRARLRKYIETEQVQTTVPVQREEIRVERETITDANRGDALSGGDLTEEEHEVTLRAEEAVVDKEVVPKERIRLDKDVVTEERQVSEEVRKEQIDIDGDGVDADRGGSDRDRTDRV
ncbi:MAG: PRC and DUF2382 domain-containing protein [Solirubrobacterales bacterium]|nr:PRC and DUF2382 domain-containing protein [Solirubrobacterales bacterium]